MDVTGHYQIGVYRFNVAGAAVAGPNGERHLEDRVARTLALLCRHRGQIVTRQAILDEVWQGRSVSENSVAIVIAELRQALDDDARAPTHIVTVSKRGYRLNLQQTEVPAHQHPIPSAKRSRPGLAIGIALSAALAVTAAIAVLIAIEASPARPTLLIEPVRNDTGSAGYASLSNALDTLVLYRVVHGGAVTAIAANSQGPTVAAKYQMRLSSNLTLWNGLPTLAMTATDISTGRVRWSGVAVAPADRIAALTATKLDEFTKLEKAR